MEVLRPSVLGHLVIGKRPLEIWLLELGKEKRVVQDRSNDTMHAISRTCYLGTVQMKVTLIMQQIVFIPQE